jgi:hypothetical protein
MSWQASISIDFWTPIANPYDSIMALTEVGWRISWMPGEGVVYLPLEDDGDYGWEGATIDKWPAVIEEIKQKITQHEEVGIQLHYEETTIQLVFCKGYGQLFANINNVARRSLSDCDGVTDFSWYLSRILPSLIKLHGSFARLECIDLP